MQRYNKIPKRTRISGDLFSHTDLEFIEKLTQISQIVLRRRRRKVHTDLTDLTDDAGGRTQASKNL